MQNSLSQLCRVEHVDQELAQGQVEAVRFHVQVSEESEGQYFQFLLLLKKHMKKCSL